MYKTPNVDPTTPNRSMVKHMVMNPYQMHTYAPFSETPEYSSVVTMLTRLEKFTVGEILEFDWTTPYSVIIDQIEGCSHYIKRDMTKRLSDIGLLIPDSVDVVVEEYPRVDDDRRKYRVLCHANALMPTATGEKEPARHYCDHCGSTAFEDQYHSGTCENCGAPFAKGTRF